MRRLLRNFDYYLLLLTLLLLAFGWFMVRSAQPSDRPYALYQAIWIVVGLAAFFAASFVDYRLIGHFTRPLYVVIVLVLGVVLALGHTAFGGQRWFQLFFFSIQPSEFAKLIVILMVAQFLGTRQVGLRAGLVSAVLAAVPAVLIFLQPSLSIAAILVAIWLGMLFAAGFPKRYFAGAGIAFVAALPIIWTQLLADYMRERVLVFLDPLADPSGAGYNLLQSRIAIGSGGLLGQGYGAGTQSQLGYLRVRHTDFIFSVIAEELGFLGALALFVLLVLLLFRLLHGADLARDATGRLIVAGVTTMIFVQTFINLGVNLGIVPPTGIGLPLISYGGSNLLTTMIGIGLVESVVVRHRRLEFE